MKNQYKIGDKVFVSDWGKLYSSKFIYPNGVKIPRFNWNIEFPGGYFNDIAYHIKREYKPKLTLKGTPFKNGDQILVKEEYLYINYEYEIIDIIIIKDNISVYLLRSKEDCIVQMQEGGIEMLTDAELINLQFISQDNSIKALAKGHLKKWRITDDLSKFPTKLLKVIYDSNQNVLFGSSSTKGIVCYNYIDKVFTVNNVDIILNSSVEYNGVGCDLTDKETMSYNDLHKRFTENTFV